MSVDQHSPNDPLLSCLVTMTRLANKPFSADTLTAGLPLEDHKLTPEIFVRAAERGELDARLVKCAFRKIKPEMLPVVLILEDQDACVLKYIENGQAYILQGDSLEPEAISLDALKSRYAGQAIFAAPAYKFDERAEDPVDRKEKHWFWSVVLKAWPLYSEVLIASFVVNMFAIAVPLFVMNVYDRVVPNNATETLWVLAIGMFIVIGFEFLMRNLRGYFIDFAAKNIDAKLAGRTFEQVLGLSMSSRPNSVGTLANTITAFESFRDFITSATVTLLVDLPFIFIFLGVIWMLGGNLVFVPLATISAILLVSAIIQHPVQKLVSKTYRHAAEKQAVLVESLVGAETIKTLRAEGPRQSRWESIVAAASKLNIKVRVLVNLATNFSMSMQFMTTVGIVIVGVYAIVNGNLTVGALIACTILSGRALAPVSQISSLMIRYKQTKTALDGIDNIMQSETDRPRGKSYLRHPSFKGKIQFQDVSFAYPNSQVGALDKISFDVKAGEHVGIIGHTGSGKSTIEKLILKLYSPADGKILVDDTEINQIDPAELRRSIGYVPQNVVLFHGSIRDNIVMSAPYVDDETILRAAKISGVMNFVNHHPDGFDRQVGERGEFLSGGQQQAIGIARAVLLNPDVYIFDEPTNSMDNLSMKQFMVNFQEELKGKTFILISHKASMLNLVDRLVVMDHGKLVTTGPREKILRLLSDHKPEAKV